MLKVLSATPAEYLKFRQMAINCPPLDVHTPYTYWVVVNFFSDECFFLVDDDKIVGSIMTLTKGNTIFVWQIAILEEYRSKGYSAMLYGSVFEYGKEHGMKKIMVSIDPGNKRSLAALYSFCEKNAYTVEVSGDIDIDIPDESCKEFEDLYSICLQ